MAGRKIETHEPEGRGGGGSEFHLVPAGRSDIAAVQPRLTYDYFQRQLGVPQQQRGEIADIFDKIIKELQKDR